MRIAISGSHSLGKSTVVKGWLETHPEFRHEDEPYRVLGLHGPYEIKFRESSTRPIIAFKCITALVGCIAIQMQVMMVF